MRRQEASAEPPGGMGTINVIGLVGYRPPSVCCASPGVEKNTAARRPRRNPISVFRDMVVIWVSPLSALSNRNGQVEVDARGWSRHGLPLQPPCSAAYALQTLQGTPRK